jgi:hypothetical protein
MDPLEKEIRDFAFSDRGAVDRETVGLILLEMLRRIQKLEAAHDIKGDA